MRLWPILLGLLATLALGGAVAAEPASYRDGAERFVGEMADRHGFDAAELRGILGEARYRQEIIDAIRRPWEAKPWREYRAIFVTDARITGGARFWREHAELLERARSAYGVPPEIITAIIGVETNYGANLGRHRVLDALSTLGFSYPKRAEFFRKELEHFLLLSREDAIDTARVTGSYAGAMGMPQFIPSSYRAYAVDFDDDGRRDLWESRADAVGSVANYFKRHGWRAGEAVAVSALAPRGVPKGLTVAGKKPAKPDTRLSRLEAQGVRATVELDTSTPVSLVRLDGEQDEYWLGLENFYVITRYNHSNLYAMAVYQLSREIKGRYEAEGGKAAASDQTAKSPGGKR